MSNIDLEKDDLATQQMVEMMQSLSKGKETDIDELLNSINEVESAENQIDENSAVTETAEPEQEAPPLQNFPSDMPENHLDDGFVDELIVQTPPKEYPNTTEVQNEEPQPSVQAAENEQVQNSETDLLEEMLVSAEAETEHLDQEFAQEPDTETSQSLDDLDELIDSGTSNWETKPELEEINKTDLEEQSTAETPSSAVPEDESQLYTLCDQTDRSVELMNESIQLDNSSNEIIEQLTTTAQMTTKMAIATAQKAQTATQSAQATIEKTFASIEHARKLTEDTEFQIEVQELKQLNDSNLDEMLAEIEAKNQQLRAFNEALAQRIASLYKS